MNLQSRVGNFKPSLLSSPWSKMNNLSAHSVENNLNFPKLTQLLSVAHFLRPLGGFEHKRAFFLGHPVGSLFSHNGPTNSHTTTLTFEIHSEC